MLDMGGTTSKEYSEETAQDIDAEVARLVEEAHERVRRMLTERREQLEIVSQKLLEQETLTGDELQELLEKGFAANKDKSSMEERLYGGSSIAHA